MVVQSGPVHLTMYHNVQHQHFKRQLWNLLHFGHVDSGEHDIGALHEQEQIVPPPRVRVVVGHYDGAVEAVVVLARDAAVEAFYFIQRVGDIGVLQFLEFRVIFGGHKPALPVCFGKN